MSQGLRSVSPTILLRISDGTFHTAPFLQRLQSGRLQRRGVRRRRILGLDDLRDRSLPDGIRLEGERVAV